jgi:hypothetical protein
MFKLFITVVLFTILYCSDANSQETTLSRDLECWAAIGIQKKLIDKKLTLGLHEQLRFDHDMNRLNQFFTNIEANYEVYKNLGVGVGYRFIKSGDIEDGFLSEHRVNADISYRKKIDRLKVEGRIRYQSRSNAQYKEYPVQKYRFRLKFNYNIKNWKYDPFFAAEMFHAKESYVVNYIDEITELKSTSDFEKIRLRLGTNIKTGGFGGIKLFYLFEHQFATYSTNYYVPVNWNIIGINYTFKF